MTKKIEFTDRAKNQIEKIISKDQAKKFFRISVYEETRKFLEDRG